MNKERCQRLVGKLIYLTHARPDLLYAISIVSQFVHNPSDQHMNVVNYIPAYMKSSLSKGIMFSKHEHLDIKGLSLSNLDWIESLPQGMVDMITHVVTSVHSMHHYQSWDCAISMHQLERESQLCTNVHTV